MPCPLCSLPLGVDTVKPGPAWPRTHFACFERWDQEEEALEAMTHKAEGHVARSMAKQPSARKPEPITEPCKGPGCDRPVRARGYCDTHYRQARKGTLGRITERHVATLPRRAA